MKDAKANQFAGDVITRTANWVQRFNDLCRQAIILSEIGSLSEDTYRVASQALEEIYKHCVNANNFARSTLESNKLVLNGFDVEEKNDGCYRAKPTKKRKSFNKRVSWWSTNMVLLELVLTCSKWWAFLNRFCILQECSDPERINIKMLDDFQKRVCYLLLF